MTTLILLSKDDAEVVRGDALQPVALTDGSFMLSTAVLKDPTHAAHHKFLETLPQVDAAKVMDLIPQPEEFE